MLGRCADSGNSAARTQLAEINHMCAHLQLDSALDDTGLDIPLEMLPLFDSFCEPFSFNLSATNDAEERPVTTERTTNAGQAAVDDDSQHNAAIMVEPGAEDMGFQDGFAEGIQSEGHLNRTDLSNIRLDDGDEMYWMHKDTNFSFAASDDLDWWGLDPWMS